MAEIIAERPKLKINLDPLVDTIRGLVNIRKNAAEIPVPWQTVWKSKIPHSVIYETAGLALIRSAALEARWRYEGVEAVEFWDEKSRKDLLTHLQKTPHSIKVYEMLLDNHMIIPDLDITEWIKNEKSLGRRIYRIFDTAKAWLLEEGSQVGVDKVARNR